MNHDNTRNKATGAPNSWLSLVYVGFLIVAMFVYHCIAEREFSSVLTLSAIFQFMAMCLLGMHVLSTGSIHGISAKCLQLEAVALVCRLASTTWLEGYLANDSSGEHLYQACDFLSLGITLGLIYQVMTVQRATYEAENDFLSTPVFVVVCFILACFLHADLDERPLFDAIWLCHLFLASTAVLPQLWLMARKKTAVPALLSHFVAAMALSRVLSGSYYYAAHEEVTCEPWFGGNPDLEGADCYHAGIAILGSHALHLLLLADFAYFYVKNLATSGLIAPMQLPETWCV